MRVTTEKFDIEAICHFNGIVRESRTETITKDTKIYIHAAEIYLVFYLNKCLLEEVERNGASSSGF